MNYKEIEQKATERRELFSNGIFPSEVIESIEPMTCQASLISKLTK